MSIKFCDSCACLATAGTLSGTLQFQCGVCKKTFAATPEDTLRFEIYLEAAESGEKFKTMIENSPHDLARTLVPRKCVCGMPYMTMVYVGKDYTVMYTCTCGNITN